MFNPSDFNLEMLSAQRVLATLTDTDENTWSIVKNTKHTRGAKAPEFLAWRKIKDGKSFLVRVQMAVMFKQVFGAPAWELYANEGTSYFDAIQDAIFQSGKANELRQKCYQDLEALFSFIARLMQDVWTSLPEDVQAEISAVQANVVSRLCSPLDAIASLREILSIYVNTLIEHEAMQDSEMMQAALELVKKNEHIGAIKMLVQHIKTSETEKVAA